MKKILLLSMALPALVMAGGWAEERLAAMNLREKVGQLFVAPLDPMRGEDHRSDWTRLMQERHVGNALMKASDAASQIAVLERIQAASKLPVLRSRIGGPF